MKKNKSKYLISTMLCLSILIASIGNIAFASGTKTCDNDPQTSGCSGTVYSGSWTLTSYASSYSGDHRINTTSSPSPEYLWGLATGLSTSTALNLYVNLATSTATCIEADYYGVGGYIGYLNQATASTGSFANYIGYSVDSGAAPIYVIRGSSTGNLVADAVKLSW